MPDVEDDNEEEVPEAAGFPKDSIWEVLDKTRALDDSNDTEKGSWRIVKIENELFQGKDRMLDVKYIEYPDESNAPTRFREADLHRVGTHTL